MIDYTVSELSARSPDMSDADFAAFVEDIRTNGQLVPIWIRGGEVIDGRKRLAACRQLCVEPKVINIDPNQDAEAVARALNVLRTHYTASQRAMFAAERVNATKGDNKRDIHKNGDVVTAGEAARDVGVHVNAVQEAKRVRRVGAPEVADAVKRGRLTLHAASQIVDEVSVAKQPAAVERVVEASKGKSRHTPVASVLKGVDRRRDRAVPKPVHEQFARAVQMIDVASEIIAKHADAAANDARRKEFLESLREARTTITRTINALEIAA